MLEESTLGCGIFALVRSGDREFFVCNFHGVAKPGDKLDTPKRVAQSEGLIQFFENKPGLKIIGGDFNLLPDTKSIRLFRENGYRDLIAEYHIPTTRNHFAWDLYPEKQLFSDYVFTSPEVKIKTFSAPNIEISDHLPLIVELLEKTRIDGGDQAK